MEKVQVMWFEIPVSDMQRAKNFYERVFEVSINIMDFGALQMGIFSGSGESDAGTGALVYHPKAYFPSNPAGVLLYLSSTNVAEQLVRVKEAGGEILQEARLVSASFGTTGLFVDSEGNRIALRSPK